MKKLIVLMLLVSPFANADCDYSTGITKKSDNEFVYSRDCHIRTGEVVKENENLHKAIDLKDLAISKSEERTELWKNTSFKMEDRVTAIEDLKSKNELLYFGAGFLGALAVTYGASRLMR